MQETDRQEAEHAEKKTMNLKKEGVMYLIFGVLTTILNYYVLGLWTGLFGNGMESVQLGNVVAFAFAVTFAFVTNKLFVFQNKDWSFQSLKKEIPAFLSARLISLGVEQLGLFLGGMHHVEEHVFLNINGVMYLKAALSVFVVIFNYFASKFFVFRKKKTTE